MTPGRVTPTSPPPLPDVQPEAGKATFLSYAYGAGTAHPCTPIVVLRIPPPFASGSPAGLSVIWQLNRLVRYAGAGQPLEPGTPELFSCVGHCEGRMDFEISNDYGAIGGAEPERSYRSMLEEMDKMNNGVFHDPDGSRM